MTWKFSSDRPLYQQIMEQIQGAILSGELPIGQRIPSVRDLATMARVNPNTMQHALQALEAKQLLITDGTNGRFVTSDPVILETIRSERLQALVDDCVNRFAAYGIGREEAAALLCKSTERIED